MKFRTLFLLLCLPIAALVANTGHSPVTQVTTGANAGDIDADIAVPSGKSLAIKSGGTLTLAGSLSGAPTSGSLDLSNLSVSLPATFPTASTVNGWFADPSTNGGFSASAWLADLGTSALYQPLTANLTAISGTESVGPAPVAGSTVSSGSTRFNSTACTLGGTLTSVSLYVTGATTYKLKIVRKVSALSFSAVATIWTGSLANGANTLTSADFGSVTIQSGDYLAVYSASGTINYAASANNSSYSVSGDVAGAFTLSAGSTAQLALQWTVSGSRVDDLRSQVKRSVGEVSWGVASPASGLVASSGTTRITGSVVPDVNTLLTKVSLNVNGAGVVNLKVLRPNGSTYDLAYNVPLTVASGLNQLRFGTDWKSPVILQYGDLIGVYPVNTSLYYASGGSAYTYLGEANGSNLTLSSSSNTWQIGFSGIPLALGEGRMQNLETLSTGFNSRATAWQALRRGAYIVDTRFPGIALPSGFVASATSGSWTVANGVASPVTGDYSTYLYYDAQSSLDRAVTEARIKAVDASSIFGLVRRGVSIAGTVAEVDGNAGNLNLYRQWSGGTPAAVSATTSIGFSLVANRDYIIRLERGIGFNSGYWRAFNTLTLIDTVTNASKSLTAWLTQTNIDDSTNSGSEWGKPGVFFKSGQILVKEFRFGTPWGRSPKVAILGDSLTEGNTISDYRDRRWAQQVVAAVGGDGVISGRGGATSADLLLRTIADLDSLSPENVIVMIGSNDTTFTTWEANLSAIITKIQNLGARPILCTLPPRSDRQTFINSANDWIRSSPYAYIDFASALTDSHDGVTWHAALEGADSIHPTVAGHDAMFQQALADVPWLFNVGAASYARGTSLSNSLSSGSAVSLTTDTGANITSVTLGAGKWRLWGVVGFSAGSGCTTTYNAQGISATSGTLPGDGSFSRHTAALSTAADEAEDAPAIIVEVAAPTTFYLVGKAAFSGGILSAYGTLNAERL